MPNMALYKQFYVHFIHKTESGFDGIVKSFLCDLKRIYFMGFLPQYV